MISPSILYMLVKESSIWARAHFHEFNVPWNWICMLLAMILIWSIICCCVWTRTINLNLAIACTKFCTFSVYFCLSNYLIIRVLIHVRYYPFVNLPVHWVSLIWSSIKTHWNRNNMLPSHSSHLLCLLVISWIHCGFQEQREGVILVTVSK